nr:histone-lysine N-methyltransferase family member SUVH9-like [Tanacetum cinerariifolium]
MIVLGSYEDDEDAGDVIVYTADSRQDKHSRQLVHQKLEGGNLTMEMSMHYGIKVRVIQGFKYEGSASGTVYVYDRMENQVEMGSTVLKFANTLRTRSLEARLSGRPGGNGDQGSLLPRSMRLDVPKLAREVLKKYL